MAATGRASTALRPIDARVVRWGGGLPQYAVGHVARIERLRSAVAAAGRLAICGAVLDGVGIAACVAAADRAVADLRADLAALDQRAALDERGDLGDQARTRQETIDS